MAICVCDSCFHRKVCESLSKDPLNKNHCKNYHDAKTITQLPCVVGEPVYYIQPWDGWKLHVGTCTSVTYHSGGVQVNFNDMYGDPMSLSPKHVFHRRRDAKEASVIRRGNCLANKRPNLNSQTVVLCKP